MTGIADRILFWFMERVMPWVLVALIVAFAGWVAVGVWLGIGAMLGGVDRGACLRAHVVTVDHPSRRIWLMAGKTIIPTQRAAYTSEEVVCDQWQFPNGRP